MKLLLENWRKYIDEIEERPSLQDDPKKDSIEMVLWAKEGAEYKLQTWVITRG